MADLVVRDVYLDDGRGPLDLAAAHGRILAIGPSLDFQGQVELNGEGCLLSPPFVDAHAHLDKAFLMPAVNKSGTLEEAIEIMAADKRVIQGPDLEQRVDKALNWYLQNGALAIRTHVDVDSITGTESIERLLRIKQRWSDIMTIQIVAFPQEGLLRDPGAGAQLRRAMEMGADLVGGIPAIEGTPKAAQEHINHVFSLAVEFGKDIDMHIDETDDPSSRTLEMLASATIEAGWEGRVSAGHCVALAAYDDRYAREVIEKVARARINVITNPTTNLVLQGRNDPQPVRRGITRVKELLEAGVNVACGHDNLRDVFYPFGQSDMLEVAFVTALAAQLTGEEEIITAFDMPRRRAAAILGIESTGIRENGVADFILIPHLSPADALARRHPRRAVIRAGRLISHTEQSTTISISVD